MELVKIEQLLDKYNQAQTTLDEEQLLRTYFQSNEVPDHLYEYKIMFNYFTQNAEQESPDIQIPKEPVRNKWYAMAAAVVLLISIMGVYQSNRNEQRQARLAYLETQKALELIATQLNKGNDAIAQLDKFEVTQKKVFK